jgi:hypothetical protein
MSHIREHKFIRYLLYCLHLFLGVNACVGGLLLMIKSDGSLLQMNQDFLKNSGFSNFFIPGLLLFTFVGLLSMLTFCGLAFKFNFKMLNLLNIYSDRHWAWAFSLYTGITTILWITIQLLITAYFWIQPVIILTGLSILICSLTPGIMQYYKTNKS